MQAFLAVTDKEWFRFLSGLPNVDEVNFWQPSPHPFKALQPGEPLLFKLHHPDNAIAGGGFFAGYAVLPCAMAWEAFGAKNGAQTLDAMVERIQKYRHEPVDANADVGCILLEQPFFFPPDEWIPAPADFAKNIVTGKGYNLRENPDIWEAVQMKIMALGEAFDESTAEMFTEGWVRQRLGQGSFRTLVTETYERRCAITGEKILPVLQAAHIRPVARGGLHRIDNGLLLRSDVHTLYDRGYLSVSPDRRLQVSPHLRQDFDNGEFYYEMAGSEIWIPPEAEDQPSREALEWHSETVLLR